MKSRHIANKETKLADVIGLYKFNQDVGTFARQFFRAAVYH